VGFDNHDLSGVMGLSTVDQDVRGQGRAAAELLLDALHSGSPAGAARAERMIDTRLVLRHSSAPPDATQAAVAALTTPVKEED
jgi:DNA-binding LacI/PurR family transcriptional regulator